ncbi:M20 family metallopeptidase [Streptomyces caniscabiei]|uniref:M20 family metallopeptidase n=1 Tax=Streptomyces caniscabiei TaxID=2746961 RepID=UPI0029A229E4|nr:M20 family metallopeptidase [Streptomyces caniscabiei]MDX2776673.1 M20 family metallopeptidase [Streptomyces caniscabiei]
MQQNIEATLEKLVAIPSTSYNPDTCREVIEFVRSEIEPLGLFIHSDMDRPNPWLLATTQNTPAPATVLAAHLDVAPASPNLFGVRRDHDKLYGRGVFDMKFAAACYIEFAKAHAALLPTLDIGFFFTTDEEISGASVAELVDGGWHPGRVLIPDGGKDWQIEERAKGFYGAQLTATGKNAHGSRPWEGKNAVHNLMDILTALRQEWPVKGVNDATFSVTGLTGGSDVFNQIPDTATALIDFRTFSTEELTAFTAQLTSLAAERDIIVTIIQTGEPVAFDKTSPAVQDFLEALHAVRGEAPNYTVSYGGTDARHFAKANIPTIIVVPRGGELHGDGEWILAEDLDVFYQLLVRWLVK